MKTNMKVERVRSGLTAKQVAGAVGVTENVIYAWERGEYEPRAANIVALAHLYGCSPDYLLGLTNDRVAFQPLNQ